MKALTAREIIEELQKLPPEAIVVGTGDRADGSEGQTRSR
jgi:hypothetical protein